MYQSTNRNVYTEQILSDLQSLPFLARIMLLTAGLGLRSTLEASLGWIMVPSLLDRTCARQGHLLQGSCDTSVFEARFRVCYLKNNLPSEFHILFLVAFFTFFELRITAPSQSTISYNLSLCNRVNQQGHFYKALGTQSKVYKRFGKIRPMEPNQSSIFKNHILKQ